MNNALRTGSPEKVRTSIALKPAALMIALLLMPCWLNNNTVTGANIPEGAAMQPAVAHDQEDALRTGTVIQYHLKQNVGRPVTQTTNHPLTHHAENPEGAEEPRHHDQPHDLADEKHLCIKLRRLMRILLGLLVVVILIS